uniref:DNA2/NAM7 helicase-like C-terminal domain-containing protein n=1 Tax=Ditylenchus dipsaci TaxID=166011 RepID=A0A915EFR5_9BILA
MSGVYVYTSDEFQGNERKVVIVSLARTTEGLGFLQDSWVPDEGRPRNRRINVTMTRASETCIIIGHPEMFKPQVPNNEHSLKYPQCAKQHTLMALYEKCESNGNIYQADLIRENSSISKKALC